MTAVSIELVRVNSTPLALLQSVLLLSAAIALVGVVLSQVFAPLVDRRWPPAQLLTPSDLLWVQLSKYVESNFGELEPELGRDLATQLRPRKLAAGEVLVRQGESASKLFVVKSGTLLASRRTTVKRGATVEEDVAEFGKGSTLGDEEIARDRAWSFELRAKDQCELLELDHADFLAGAALKAVAVALTVEAGETREAPEPTVRQLESWRPTHAVGRDEVPWWSEPDAGTAPRGHLAAGQPMMVAERLGVWACAIDEDGVEHWVAGASLVPR